MKIGDRVEIKRMDIAGMTSPFGKITKIDGSIVYVIPDGFNHEVELVR